MRNANIPKQPATNYSENSIKRTYCSIPTIFQHGFFYKPIHNKKEPPVLSEERPLSVTKPFISSIFASPFFANPSTKSKKKKKKVKESSILSQTLTHNRKKLHSKVQVIPNEFPVFPSYLAWRVAPKDGHWKLAWAAHRETNRFCSSYTLGAFSQPSSPSFSCLC